MRGASSSSAWRSASAAERAAPVRLSALASMISTGEVKALKLAPGDRSTWKSASACNRQGVSKEEGMTVSARRGQVASASGEIPLCWYCMDRTVAPSPAVIAFVLGEPNHCEPTYAGCWVSDVLRDDEVTYKRCRLLVTAVPSGWEN